MSKFIPSAAEVALVNQIFAQADTQKLGIITGDAAVKVFSGAKLSSSVLAEVWNLADEDNNGVLTRKGVAVAIRLLGHAQRGDKVSEAMINKPGPVPTIEGLTPPIVQQTTGIPAARSPPPGLPPLTPQDKAKFMNLFIKCGPTNGLLGGDKARDVFVKSKLPVDKLSQIWNLADTKNRGALDATDFTIAMYLIQACMSGLQNLPPSLPPGIHEQAAAKSPFDSVATHATGSSAQLSPSFTGSFSGRPLSTIEPHYTGQSALQPQMTGSLQTPRPNLAPQVSPFTFVQPQATSVQQQHWDVTPAEKASADGLFDTLDRQKRGYIEGDIAVPFMLQSKLPEDVLAQVWDLADINNDGRLTRDGFAVAMHLIQGKLNGKDVPATIPPTLIPPSMRTPTVAPVAPPQPSASEAIRDLIWDDSPPTTATAPHPPIALQPQATGTLGLQPQASGIPASRTPIASPPPPVRSQTVPDPFNVGSPFAAPPPPQAQVHRDLLGDDDEVPVASSPPLQDRSAEIGNIKNQLSSTNRSLDTAKAERENLERALAEQAAQLSALQTQLSSAKAAYETETRLLETLRERFNKQTAEIQKAREELIHGESDLSAVRVEKAEIEGGLLRDKEEVRDLQRKMTEVGMQTETLKTEIEKLKKEAKQQKGLLAIAKKQLATREAERAKVEKELGSAQAELDKATKEREEAEAEVEKEVPASVTNGHAASPDILALAAAQPLPATPDIPTSPTGSVLSLGKSNNPFERVALASGAGSRSQSPFLPFTNPAVLPTPPTAPAETSAPAAAEVPTPVSPASNPFLFSQALGTEAEAPTSEGHPVTSPTETDLFMTPPSSASFHKQSPPTVGEFGQLFDPTLAAPKPEEPQAPKPAEEKAEGTEQQTDLNHELKEVEVEESDSDSESEDNEPLAKVQERLSADLTGPKINGAATSSEPPAVSAFDDSFGVSDSAEEPTTPITAPAPEPAQEETPVAALAPPAAADTSAPLDDIFGTPLVPSVTAPETTPAPETAPAPLAPVTTDVKPANGSAPSTPDVDAFDEAMGKIGAGSTSNDTPSQSQFSQFGFDSAFDDNFDFAAASAAAPAPTAHGITQPQQNGTTAPAPSNAFDDIFMSQPASHVSPTPAPTAVQSIPAIPPAESQPFSFDDAFGSVSQVNPSQSGLTNGPHGISFDDAFGGKSSPLALDSSFASTSSQPAANGSTPQRQGTQAFPTISPPLSPASTQSPQMSVRRSTSPPRQMSPPPRHNSPKPRPSATSSEKEKVPNARHSKISIRLPFGRKKKNTQDPPPMPPPLATQQVREEPTPAVDDDIDAVKQLCSMGFSRTQAVTALELHDYDVQRALNNLLGAS